jgi:hypothetical protein
MGHAIPRQQPAVVLRSHFNHVRALLAVALAAVAGLTVAVVILASPSDEVASTSAAGPVESSGPLPAQLPNTRYEQGTRGPLPAQLPNTRYEQGTRGPLPAQLPNTRYQEGARGPLPAQLPSSSPTIEAKHEAATAAAIGHPGSGTEFRGSKASEYGTSQYRFAQPQTGTPAQP